MIGPIALIPPLTHLQEILLSRTIFPCHPLTSNRLKSEHTVQVGFQPSEEFEAST